MLHARRVERRAPAEAVVAREAQIVALPGHAVGHVADPRPRRQPGLERRHRRGRRLEGQEREAEGGDEEGAAVRFHAVYNTTMRRFRVSLAQINPTVGDIEGNVRRVIDDIGRARTLGADLVAFPELAITGYPPEDLLFKSAFIEANLAGLRDVTKAARGLTAIVGFVDRHQDLFNAAAVIHAGALAGVYHKEFLPNYGVFDENRYFQAGREASVFSIGTTSVAVNVCEDI